MEYLNGNLTAAEVRESSLYIRGDCINVWVNEGELHMAGVNKMLVTKLQSDLDTLKESRFEKTEDWHEDYGYCIFFHFTDFESPPDVCCDSPLGTDFDDKYWTHFTRSLDINHAVEHAMKDFIDN